MLGHVQKPEHMLDLHGYAVAAIVAVVVFLTIVRSRSLRRRMGIASRAIAESPASRSPLIALVLAVIALIAAIGLELADLHSRQVGIFLIVVACLLAIWLVRLVIYEHRRPGHQLKKECLELALKINEFLEDRSEDDPISTPLRPQLPAGATEDQIRAANIQYAIRIVSNLDKTMHRYRRKYGAQALAIFDRLCAHDLVDAKDRMVFEHPTNPLGIRQVAQILGVAGEKLPE